MAIIWGDWSGPVGGLVRTGIEYAISGANATIGYYVEAPPALAGSQTLRRSGSVVGDVTYTKTTTPAQQIVNQIVIALTPGQVYTLGAEIIGLSNGATPSASVEFSFDITTPAAPAPAAISEIINTQARAIWSAPASDGGSAITGDQIQVSKTASFSEIVFDQLSATRNILITGLQHSTFYYVRVRSRNSVGSGAWSTSQTFQTDNQIPSAPDIPAVDNIQTTSIRITSGSVPDAGGLPISQIRFQVSLNATFSSPTYDQVSVNPTTVGGLTANKIYYVRTSVVNSKGWGPWSSALQIRTANSSSSTVSGVRFSDITQESALLEWNPSGYGSLTGYYIQYSKYANFMITRDRTTNSSTTSLTMTDLEPGVRYYARVRIRGLSLWPDWSSTVSFVTLGTRPIIVSANGFEFPARSSGRSGALVSARGWNETFTITVQSATNASFSAGLVTYTLSPSVTTSDSRYELGGSDPQPNGTYYVRARLKNDATGYESDWSEVVNYTQQHSPAAVVISPTGDNFITYSMSQIFSWRFADSANPLDQQTSYQFVVENAVTGASVYDSTKTALITSGSNPTVTRTVSLGAGVKNIQLRWRVRVWDRNDQVSPWSGYALFTLADGPVVTALYPEEGEQVESGNPSFVWDSTFPSGGIQASATLRVYQSDTGELIWSRTITGTAEAIDPTQVILRNGRTYYYVVDVTDSRGLIGSDSQTFTVSYIAPEVVPFSVNADPQLLDERGYVYLDWSNMTPDLSIVSWVVYRRIVGELEWIEIANIPDVGQRYYQDWSALGGFTYQYAITQRANRSGQSLESPIESQTSPPVSVVHSHYWLIVEDDSAASLQVANVTSDSFSEDYEQSSRTVINRGRHVDYGTRLGYSGTLEVQLLGPTARLRRQAIELLRVRQDRLFMRTPFGDYFPVALGAPSVDRIPGTSTTEMTRISIPYEEVY